VAQAIADDPAQLARYTMVGRTVAICTTSRPRPPRTPRAHGPE